jgi:hypothetical protein
MEDFSEICQLVFSIYMEFIFADVLPGQYSNAGILRLVNISPDLTTARPKSISMTACMDRMVNDLVSGKLHNDHPTITILTCPQIYVNLRMLSFSSCKSPLGERMVVFDAKDGHQFRSTVP